MDRPLTNLRDALTGPSPASSIVHVFLFFLSKALGLWEHRPGFDTFKRRARFNNLGYLRKLRETLEGKTGVQRARFIFEEMEEAMAAPKRIKRFRDFCRQNRT